MGSSCEANGKSIDSTVGGLVWVRRRNGSWWPGRILGSDELPESCLVSPRSGTPVKLLGREDASVDWYNLEKSKRVKAFRCGEYDECIEKAKVSAAISCKKAVKYARREDAILHALEIESSRLSKDCPETNSLTEKSSSQQPKSDKSPIREETEGNSDKLSGLEYTSNSPPELSQGGVSPELSQGRRKRRTPNDSEEDGNEGSKKRMRGLEDIGIGGMATATATVKRRRSQVAHVHEFLKKKNRRRQLTKVLESTTTMVSVPVTCEELKVAGLEGNESKRSLSVVINNNSDSTGDASNSNCKQKENEISSVSKLAENDSSARLFDVPFQEEKENSGVSPVLVSEKPQSGQSSLVETLPVGLDEIQEISSGTGTSKWQHKGKRNSRNKSKTIHKFISSDVLNDESKPEQITELPTGEATAPPRLLPYRQSRFTVNPKYEPSDFSYRKHDMSGSLYDVHIEVQTGLRPQHVPYISLVSKLTGQPITGHPVPVEVLNESIQSECYTSSELGRVNGDVGIVKKAIRNGLLSNKKIRRLSSLTALSTKVKKPGQPGQACVSLKVVFGRLNAALGIIGSS